MAHRHACNIRHSAIIVNYFLWHCASIYFMALSQYHVPMDKPANSRPSRESDKYIVRLPDGMRDEIAKIAAINQRSMNAEIVARLQQSFNLALADFRNSQLIEELMNRYPAGMIEIRIGKVEEEDA
jgi:Arc-like DNA binding domain